MPDIHLIIDLQVEQVIIHTLFLIKGRKAIPQSIQQRAGFLRICIRKGFDPRQGSGIRLPPMIASIKSRDQDRHQEDVYTRHWKSVLSLKRNKGKKLKCNSFIDIYTNF